MTFVRPSLVALVVLFAAAPSRADTLKVPADFETIQAAVDAAVAGDIVSVSKGIYVENVAITTAGIALRGKLAVIDGHYVGNCVSVTAADVEVSGFALVNGGGTEGTPAGGLVHTGTGAHISKLQVRACASVGIALFGTGVVEKCTVDGIVGTGILVETGDILGSVVTEVSKNKATHCFDGIALQDGPFLVEKNVLEDNADEGLSVSIPILALEGLPGVTESTVSKNDCRRNGGAGLGVAAFSGGGLVVEKNTTEENLIGVFADGVGIALLNNTIEDNRVGGIFLQTTSSEFSKNKVRGNGFVGVLVTAASLSDGRGFDGSNLLLDNTVQDNGGDGVRVSSDNNVVESNLVKDNLGDGIMLLGEGITGNEVHDNTLKGNSHDGIDNWTLLTLIHENVSKDNGGADLAGVGNGAGTVDKGSGENETGDGTGLESEQELELETITL